MKAREPISNIENVEIEKITRDQILSVLSVLKKKKVSSRPNNP
jgi:hypothetical protein